jgi:hypothetical protein
MTRVRSKGLVPAKKSTLEQLHIIRSRSLIATSTADDGARIGNGSYGTARFKSPRARKYLALGAVNKNRTARPEFSICRQSYTASREVTEVN